MTENLRDKRRQSRDPSFARVILEHSGCIGYVADVSDDGFRVRSVEGWSGEVTASDSAGISFAEESIAFFRLPVTVCWYRQEASSIVLGCRIEPGADPSASQQYQRIIATYRQGDFNGSFIESCFD